MARRCPANEPIRSHAGLKPLRAIIVRLRRDLHPRVGFPRPRVRGEDLRPHPRLVVANGDHAELRRVLVGDVQMGVEVEEVASVVLLPVVRRRVEEDHDPRQGVEEGEGEGSFVPVGDEEVTAAAVLDVPVGDVVGRPGGGGEEEVATANGGEPVPIEAAGRGEGGDGGAAGVEEEAEEGRRVEGAEAAAEGPAGGDRAAPREAGASGTDERR